MVIRCWICARQSLVTATSFAFDSTSCGACLSELTIRREVAAFSPAKPVPSTRRRTIHAANGRVA
jgi:hypothetical protein